MVDPAELKAFHTPKAVPMQACEGTRRGIEAIKGICEVDDLVREFQGSLDLEACSLHYSPKQPNRE